MPTLVFEHDGQQRAGALNGRVLIGRRLSHGVVIADPAVSRLHAWIDNREGAFVLTDAGSRTGTFVNGNAIVRYELQHGDTIKIGPATVRFVGDEAATEEAADAGLELLDLSSHGATVQSSKQGIIFDCACGAPLWVPVKWAGKRGLCRYCGEPVRVPMPAEAAEPLSQATVDTPAPVVAASKPAAAPAEPGALDALAAAVAAATPPRRQRPATPTLAAGTCGVCHSSIERDEQMTTCPDCGTKFHTDCWMENYGCSTYGCPQVNALKPAEVSEAEAASAAAAAEAAADAEVEPAPTGLPIGIIMLGAAVIASLVSALLFGLLSAAVALVALGMMFSKKPGRRRGVLFAAMLVAIVGTAAGLALSDFWWLGGTHLPAALRVYLPPR